MTLEQLIELATKATPGPWKRSVDALNQPIVESNGLMSIDILDSLNTRNDAEYIAALSPDTLIPMLETLRALLEINPWSFGIAGQFCIFSSKCKPWRKGWHKGDPYLTLIGSDWMPEERDDEPEEHAPDCVWNNGQRFLKGES